MTGTGLRFEDGRLFLMHQDGTETELHKSNEVPELRTTSIELDKNEPILTIDANGLTLASGIDFSGKDIWEKLMEKRTKEKKEGNKMELLNMYKEKSEKNINDFYDMLKRNETENDIVKKEFDELIDKFDKDIKKLADKYNPYNGVNGSYIVEEKYCILTIPYHLYHDESEKEKEIEKMRENELHQLEEKIREVSAHLDLLPIDKSHAYVMDILRLYDIVNEDWKVTPYMPTFKEECDCSEECPCKETKRRGRPKKENK